MLDKVSEFNIKFMLEQKKLLKIIFYFKKALEAIDVCADVCGIRYSQINKHRSLKEIRELESYSEGHESVKPEKTIY